MDGLPEMVGHVNKCVNKEIEGFAESWPDIFAVVWTAMLCSEMARNVVRWLALREMRD
jgi:hypothetical protein